jgi:hypothetical protein
MGSKRTNKSSLGIDLRDLNLKQLEQLQRDLADSDTSSEQKPRDQHPGGRVKKIRAG